MNFAIGVSAIVIAVAALAVAILESRRSRMHFQSAVRPALVFELRDSQGELLLRNVGLGPAIIESAEIYLDGQELGRMDSRTWSRVLKRLGFPSDWEPGFLGFMFFTYGEDEEDSALAVGEQWAVVRSLRNEDEIVSLVAGIAARLKITIHYRSFAFRDGSRVAIWDGSERCESHEDFDLRMAAALSMLDEV